MFRAGSGTVNIETVALKTAWRGPTVGLETRRGNLLGVFTPACLSSLLSDLLSLGCAKILRSLCSALRAAKFAERYSVRVLLWQFFRLDLAGGKINYGFSKLVNVAGHFS